jgi:hypothetical protein
MKTLDELGLKHSTDKASSCHNYLTWYDSFLSPLREKPIRLLEMGVLGGASLRMWREYFPNGQIVGLDNDPSCDSDGPVVIGDQQNPKVLQKLITTYGPFDVIVDDAGHESVAQLFAMRALFPTLNRGGFYIIEDITSVEAGNYMAGMAMQILMNTGLTSMIQWLGLHFGAAAIRRRDDSWRPPVWQFTELPRSL